VLAGESRRAIGQCHPAEREAHAPTGLDLDADAILQAVGIGLAAFAYADRGRVASPATGEPSAAGSPSGVSSASTRCARVPGGTRYGGASHTCMSARTGLPGLPGRTGRSG
jgi:hypothetical protein